MQHEQARALDPLKRADRTVMALQRQRPSCLRPQPAVWATSLGVLAIACQDTLQLAVPDMPAAAWLGLLLFSSKGELLASTSLLRATGDSLEVEMAADLNRAVSATVVAYAASVSEQATTAPGEAGPLQLASATDPVWPPPTWMGEGHLPSDAPLRSEGSRAPELTSPGLPRCPVLIEPGQQRVTDVSCSTSSCPWRAAQEGCSIVVNAPGCASFEIEATLDGRGNLLSASARPIGVCRGRDFLMSCKGDSEVDFPACVVRLAQGDSALSWQTQPFQLREGRPTAIEALPDGRAVVSADLGADCAAPGALVWLEAEPIRQARSSTAPACIRRLELQGSDIFAAIGSNPPSVARFDRLGNLITRTDLDDLPPEARVTGLAVSADRVAVAGSFDLPRPGGFVVVTTTTTLEPIAQFLEDSDYCVSRLC